MAANGVKREDVKAELAADEPQVKLEADESKDHVKAEADDAPAVKREPRERDVKPENGRVKAEAASSGVKLEEKVKKQELEQVAAAAATDGDVKMMGKGDVKKDEVGRQQQQEDRSHICRKGVQCDAALWDSIDWTVAAGAEVDAGQRLGTAGRLELGNQRPIQAPCKGRLYILSKQQSDELMAKKAADRTIAFVEYCIHPVRNGRTCLMCLAVVEDDEENGDMESVNVVSHGQVIRLNVEEASRFITVLETWAVSLRLVVVLFLTLEKFDSDNIRRQLGAKKLSLVLDLDHTLLHAVRVDDVVGEIKQSDTPDMLHKSLKLLFPSCDDSMILVLDDRIDVWKENEGNVFLIEPYHYFKCTTEINNASGRGVAGLDDSESEESEDKHLTQSTTVLKCARSWSRVSEQDFLAEQAKAKQKKLEAEKQPDGALAPPETDATSESKVQASDTNTGAEGCQPPQVTEGKTVASILVKREPGDAKRGKQVTFAKVIDDSGNPPTEDGTVQKSKMVRRSRVVRRSSGASRPRTTVATGVVATGGTFDFLSKIKATKREPPRTSVKAKKAEETKKTPSRSASPPKDVDDAFLRLIEAEERESKEEEKRKHSSTDIKDQLFSRRTKNDGTKRAHHEPVAATTEPDEKRMRVSPPEQPSGEAEGAEEEEDEVGAANGVLSCCELP
ncbi:unnamed protein product [Phytophthora fragariaefolia]|uniref:protein-serine/threonine phosphatase n=1 Tax=Phytophthora fragariaefolia TaxID=1490495 RepID=A0A9W6XV84_9STRA|nr:unnamed protein product [Phytophthora fragariaefolia]